MESSLIQRLITSDTSNYQRATQSQFLLSAAEGKLPKALLGQWLANDSLYIHSYIQGLGRLLSFLELPHPQPTTPSVTSSRDASRRDDHHEDDATELLSWVIDALVNIQKEKNFFTATAGRYDIPIHLEETAKLDGLTQFEAIFGSLSHAASRILPWLEAAVVFYATEKVYLDAWSWAKSQQQDDKDDGGRGRDEDGGALRKEFIPNWTNDDFVAFVDRLGQIIDKAVAKAVQAHGVGIENELFQRSLAKWKEVLAAEESFWPQIPA